MRTLLLLVQIASTLSMTGIIWFVQVVHYPLFARVGAPGFAQYEAAHATRTGWVVAPLMCAELLTSALLLTPGLRPRGVSLGGLSGGMVLVIVIWLSTALLQVPLHDRLARGYDAEIAAHLVMTNWIRTAAWSLRSALVLAWAGKLLSTA